MPLTHIAWTSTPRADGTLAPGYTWNPWEGCTKVSPGCKHCYAETRNERFHGGQHWGADAPRLMRSPAYWREPLKWAKAARAAGERRRVFCASLADVFEDRPDVLDARARLFGLIEQTPELDWLLLTKRPENMVRLAPDSWTGGWPSHVWAGCTAEDQAHLDKRIHWLVDVPARVKFLSCEPLIEPINLRSCGEHRTRDALNATVSGGLVRVDWVIVGGESGSKARPFDLAWARSIVSQCAEAGVPCFVKQLGARPVGDWGPGKLPQLSDRPPRHWVTRHPAGADPSEWPEDLRVQQWPAEEVRRG